jgi:hypothetical protein
MKLEVFENSFQSESKMTNSFVNDDSTNNQKIFDSEKELSAISNEEKNLNQRYMMTKALTAKNNSFDDFVMKISNEKHDTSNHLCEMTFNAHVIASERNVSLERFSISRDSNSSDQLLTKNSILIHHIENNAILSEKIYESVEK